MRSKPRVYTRGVQTGSWEERTSSKTTTYLKLRSRVGTIITPQLIRSHREQREAEAAAKEAARLENVREREAKRADKAKAIEEKKAAAAERAKTKLEKTKREPKKRKNSETQAHLKFASTVL